jgi:hypothetical protein
MTTFTLSQQFCGPPNSGNGGYVCGLMAKDLQGPVTAILRAPPALEAPLTLERRGAGVRLVNAAGDLIGEAHTVAGDLLPDPPSPPDVADAIAAGRRFPGLERPFHPICFTCGDRLQEGYGLRVFTGQIDGAAEGHVAGAWAADPAFADQDGLVPEEIVWAAIDCPGSVAWVVGGHGGALLGTMTCEVLRRPAVGETCIVTAWPLQREGRKKTSGAALFSAGGELLARAHEVWSGRPMAAQAA